MQTQQNEILAAARQSHDTDRRLADQARRRHAAAASLAAPHLAAAFEATRLAKALMH